jgi:hypothetical protein
VETAERQEPTAEIRHPGLRPRLRASGPERVKRPYFFRVAFVPPLAGFAARETVSADETRAFERLLADFDAEPPLADFPVPLRADVLLAGARLGAGLGALAAVVPPAALAARFGDFAAALACARAGAAFRSDISEPAAGAAALARALAASGRSPNALAAASFAR